jgi:hypothetical protein
MPRFFKVHCIIARKFFKAFEPIDDSVDLSWIKRHHEISEAEAQAEREKERVRTSKKKRKRRSSSAAQSPNDRL